MSGTPGLGAYAHAELGIPVIGVAKTRFAAATHALPVIRGQATRPLYVTAAGMPVADAAELTRRMSGKFRMPDALRRVDALSRDQGIPARSRQGSGAALHVHGNQPREHLFTGNPMVFYGRTATYRTDHANHAAAD